MDFYNMNSEFGQGMDVDPGFLYIFMGIFLSYAAVILVLIILQIIANWVLFKKAGHAGWKSLIPFYSLYTKIKIADGNNPNVLLFILCIVPLTAPFALAIMLFRFSRRFGASQTMSVLCIFFSFIIQLVLAFSDKYQYQDYEQERMSL